MCLRSVPLDSDKTDSLSLACLWAGHSQRYCTSENHQTTANQLHLPLIRSGFGVHGRPACGYCEVEFYRAIVHSADPELTLELLRCRSWVVLWLLQFKGTGRHSETRPPVSTSSCRRSIVPFCRTPDLAVHPRSLWGVFFSPGVVRPYFFFSLVNRDRLLIIDVAFSVSASGTIGY